MAKPDLTQKQYVALKGCKCPNCGSEQCEQAAYLYTFDTTNVIAGDTDNDRAILHQNCHCIRCGAEWVDVYKLTGYSNLKLAQEE
jgi:hypothetical protein